MAPEWRPVGLFILYAWDDLQSKWHLTTLSKHSPVSNLSYRSPLIITCKDVWGCKKSSASFLIKINTVYTLFKGNFRGFEMPPRFSLCETFMGLEKSFRKKMKLVNLKINLLDKNRHPRWLKGNFFHFLMCRSCVCPTFAQGVTDFFPRDARLLSGNHFKLEEEEILLNSPNGLPKRR